MTKTRGRKSGVPDAPPRETALEVAYPNPFNPRTTIRYRLSARAHVSLKIYDVSGRLVRTLVDGLQTPSPLHRIEWDGRSEDGTPVASGVYLCRMQTEGFSQIRKLVLLK